MSFVRTLDLLAAVKAQLESLPHPDREGEKLFEKVDFHENQKLREALSDLVIIKQRVAIIVPNGETYETFKEGRTRRHVRTASFDLLLADRAWTKGGHEAVFGGLKNVGVLLMKDLVIEHFIAHPQLGLPWVALEPVEAALIEIADADVKDSPGRECYVINYATPAGEAVSNPTQPWPAGSA